MRLTSFVAAGVALTVVNGLSFIEARDAVVDYTSSSVEVLKRSLPTLPKREASLAPRKDSCPAIWTSIVKDLNAMFLGSDGQCNDDARAAIRVSSNLLAVQFAPHIFNATLNWHAASPIIHLLTSTSHRNASTTAVPGTKLKAPPVVATVL
jgi:hypothetical protein